MSQTLEIREVWSNGRRYYTTPFGKLPSVTSILKATEPAEDKARLAAWQEKMREKGEDPDAISRDSAARGKNLHSMVETYLKTGVPGKGAWWASVWAFMQGVDRTQEMLIEHSIASPAGYAGALDLKATHNVTECVVDWKTSLKPKRLEWIEGFCMQTSAYTAALNLARQKVGRPCITSAAIVVAYERRACDVFWLTRDMLMDYYSRFLKRVDAFKQLTT